MDGLLLNRLDLERVQLLVKYLTEVHHDRLVHLLPQMGPEYLDEGDLERGDLAVHEDACEVELHLETHVDVGPVDGRRPPQSEPPVRDLVQTRPLRVGQLLVLHRLLEAGRLLPEQTLPGGKVGALEERVLQDALHAAQRLDHVRPVVVQVPELAVVTLVRPPEGVLLQHLVRLELRPHPPPLVVGQGVPVLLEEGVDAGDAAVPGVFQVLQGEPPVLRGGLLPLQRVLRPHSLRVDELGLPRLHVAVQVGDELVLLVAHAGPEVSDADVGLLRPPQVRLRNQHVAHGQHPEAAELLRRVEHDRRESRGHLGVEADLYSSLDFVLTLDEHVEQLLRVDHGLPEVRHEADEGRVPLVDDLGEGGGPGGHEDLPDPVVELGHGLGVDPQEALRRALLGHLVLQVPDAVAVRELLVRGPDLGQDPALEAGHGEEQVRVVFGVDGDEGVVPRDGGDGAGQSVLDVPENRPPQVNVVLHQPHAGVSRPAPLVVVAHDVLVVGVGVLGEVALDEVARLLRREPEEHVDLLDVAGVESDRVRRLGVDVLEREEVVGHLWRPGHLGGAVQTEDQEVVHEAEVLHHERGELESADYSVGVGVVHVLVVDHHVVLGRHVVGNVVVDDEAKQSVEKRQVNLLVELLESALHHDVALAVTRLPNILQVVNALAPFVREQRRGLGVGWLYPLRQQFALVGLIPQVLVQVRIRDLFEGLDVVYGNEVRIQIHELDADLFEGALRQQVTLYSRQSLVGVVVGLLDETQLFSLALIQSRLDRVCLFQPFQREDE